MKLPAQVFYLRVLLALAGGLFCAALAYFQWVLPLDRLFYDFFNERSPMTLADDIVVVAIDERSLQELGRWPWPREKHVELLRQLSSAGVAAVAMDILFAEREANYPQVDELLAEAIAAQGAVVLPVFIAQDERGGRLREVLPVEPIADAAAGLGHVHIEVDSDGVARSVFLKEGTGAPRWVHMTVALARLQGWIGQQLPGVVNPQPPQGPAPQAIVRDNQNLVPFMGPAGTVPALAYVDVMRGRVPPAELRDKIVFVGATAAGHVDNITTSLGQVSGVEINANILQALRSGNFARPLSDPAAASAMFALAVLTIWLFSRMAPRHLLLAVLASAVLLPLCAFLLLYYLRLWLSPAPIVFTLLVAYPLWNWLRLDSAVDFIREQLEDLEAENRELTPVHSWPDIERAAAFLQSLGHLSNWEWGPADPLWEQAGTDSAWQHATASSSRHFSYGGEVRRLNLHWLQGHEFVAARLTQIFPASEPVTAAGSGADFINLNLVALDNAYAQARGNRDLVKGTLEQLESGVILSLLSGEILLLNEQARTLLELDDDCMELLPALAALELEDRQDVADLVNQLIFSGLHFDHEGRVLASGREILCRGGVINLDRPMLLIVMTDVSELKESENRRAEALNFLSHDLRAPLTSVLALIEGARGEATEHQGAALLDEIERYIQKNLSYAENFIQLARIEHTDSNNLDDCEASSLVDDAVAQLFHTARKQGVELRIGYCDEPLWLRCNRSMVERALVNLLDNALKHSHRGDKVSVELGCDADHVLFSISDQGQGIPAGDMARIFGDFQQGAGASSGVGLGLRFVSAVVASHDGSIDVKNNPGGGALFTLRLARLPLQA